jgi:putative membrane protein
MPVLAQVFAALAALLHVVFFSFESVLFGRAAIQKRFFVEASQAPAVRPWALNQGFYNLFLALGVFAGLLALHGAFRIDGARALVRFCCASMTGAGLVLALTDKRLLRAALMQLSLPLVAIVLSFV